MGLNLFGPVYISGENINYQSECTVTPVHIHREYKYNKSAYLNMDIKQIARSKNDKTK